MKARSAARESALPSDSSMPHPSFRSPDRQGKIQVVCVVRSIGAHIILEERQTAMDLVSEFVVLELKLTGHVEVHLKLHIGSVHYRGGENRSRYSGSECRSHRLKKLRIVHIFW